MAEKSAVAEAQAIVTGKAKAKPDVTGDPIQLQPINLSVLEVEVVGLTELISHRWSEKAKRQMLEKQMAGGRARTRAPREPKVPEEDYESSLYKFEDGSYGFPATAFKAAMVGACRQFDGIAMTAAKLLFHVLGEGPEQLVHIDGAPRMREDMVRLETGVADIRYRGGFPIWKTTLRIRYNASLITPESIVTLLNAAGQGGVGEWRASAPKSATGSYGMFEVAAS